ncbi:hypothetical protein ACHAXA_011060 [Cyclostephanos tholiformis]|uniref:Uncharacterized protein n=1 Tax=Cyclostephanos tholiformis TaxID=382380 RepID=A0ABD3RZ04_9STRA
MIVGRNPFAMPVTSTIMTARGDRQHRDAGKIRYKAVWEEGDVEVDANDEKTRRIKQIVDRVVRGDWSVPASVIIANESMECLLNQLLEMQPRKRGTARGILNLHPFFRTKSDDTSTALQTTNRLNQCSIALNATTRMNDRSNIGSPGYTIVDSMSSESLPKAAMSMTIEKNRMQNKENILRGNVNASVILLGATKTELHNDRLHPSSRHITTNNSEKMPKHESSISPMADLLWTSFEKRHEEEKVIYSNVYESQKCKHVDFGDREKSTSIVSLCSLLSSSDDLQDVEFMPDCNQSAKEMAPKLLPSIGPIKDRDVFVKMETKPHRFTPMKFLHRLPQRKYSWGEPSENGISSGNLIVYFLGNDGVVIQREFGPSCGLWMHVTSDGLGILWGNLQPQKRQPTQHDANERSALWLEAHSRAPSEFSKRSLVSLLSLKSHDIVSLYETLESVVHRVKCLTPIITVHLYTPNKSTRSTSQEIIHSNDYVAKTMLMGNDPLADIKSEFADGTTIWLSSADGCITIKGDQGSSKLEIDQGIFFSLLKADRSPAPSSCGGMIPGLLKPMPKFVHNLCLFTESARECLLLEDRLNHSLGGCTGITQVSPPAHAHAGYSFPVVQKYLMRGWRRENWVVDDVHLQSKLECT